MKRIIGIFWAVTLLGACTSCYYYSKINSNDTTSAYGFAGEDASVTATVVNHTGQPVYAGYPETLQQITRCFSSTSYCL